MTIKANNHFQFSRRGAIRCLESTVIKNYDFIIHAFLTRPLNFSNHGDDEKGTIEKNWNRLSAAFDIPKENFFTVDQVHGTEILIIDDNTAAVEEVGSLPFDGIITAKPGCAIGVKTADCVPIFLVDPVRRIIGAVHAGWRGTALAIAAKTVDVFIKKFGSDPKAVISVIGPAIGPCCYEVDEKVLHPLKGYGNGAPFFAGEEAGKWMLDLGAINTIQLIKQGVPAGNIYSAELCTSCYRDIFFSHRGEGGGTGRQLNFIMLR